MEASRPTVGTYVRAFLSEFLAAMSGSLSAVFGAAGLYASSSWVRTLFFVMAAASFAFASYRIWSAERDEVRALESKIHEISLDRCLSYITCGYNLDANSYAMGYTKLTSWNIQIENLSDRMITYKINDIWLRDSSGHLVGLSEPHVPKWEYANARTKMQYTCLVENNGHVLGKQTPFDWTLGFTIEYDNVPRIGTRTTKQHIRYWLMSSDPLTFHNVIVSREEF